MPYQIAIDCHSQNFTQNLHWKRITTLKFTLNLIKVLTKGVEFHTMKWSVFLKPFPWAKTLKQKSNTPSQDTDNNPSLSNNIWSLISDCVWEALQYILHYVYRGQDQDTRHAISVTLVNWQDTLFERIVTIINLIGQILKWLCWHQVDIYMSEPNTKAQEIGMYCTNY